MRATSLRSWGVWTRLVCGLMISSCSALLFLLPFAFPIPVPSLSPPLEIHNCNATYAPLPAEPKRKTPGSIVTPQPVTLASLVSAQPWDWRPGAATGSAFLPPDASYLGINQFAKPPPRRS